MHLELPLEICIDCKFSVFLMPTSLHGGGARDVCEVLLTHTFSVTDTIAGWGSQRSNPTTAIDPMPFVEAGSRNGAEEERLLSQLQYLGTDTLPGYICMVSMLTSGLLHACSKSIFYHT